MGTVFSRLEPGTGMPSRPSPLSSAKSWTPRKPPQDQTSGGQRGNAWAPATEVALTRVARMRTLIPPDYGVSVPLRNAASPRVPV
jgi:hypothetical protein